MPSPPMDSIWATMIVRRIREGLSKLFCAVEGRSQKFLNFYCTILQSYILAAWRHRLQLLHKIIFRDWFWESIYTNIPPITMPLVLWCVQQLYTVMPTRIWAVLIAEHWFMFRFSFCEFVWVYHFVFFCFSWNYFVFVFAFVVLDLP